MGMTVDKAIDIIKCLAWHTRPDEEDVEQAIKTLEQKLVLDKVRDEIIEMRSKKNVGVLECLDIIDKYRAESEVNNG